jgi:hypothetical protein
MRWYEAGKMRALFGSIDSERFEQARKSHYGHQMFLGALMCGREDARAKLQTMNPRTRRRIETELRVLHTRRQGHPLVVGPDPLQNSLSIVS